MPQSFATEIAKERFYDQMERYRNLNDGLDLPAAVIPLYLAGLLFLADGVVSFWSWPWHWTRNVIGCAVLLALTAAATIFVAWAILDYCRTIWCYQDATDLPSPKELDDWLKGMEQFAVQSNTEPEGICDGPLRDYYVTAAESTFKQNETRSRKLFYCRRRLVVSLVLITMAMAAYYVTYRLVKSGAEINGRTTESSEAPTAVTRTGSGEAEADASPTASIASH